MTGADYYKDNNVKKSISYLVTTFLIVGMILLSSCINQSPDKGSYIENPFSPDQYDEVLPLENGTGLIRKGESWGYYTGDKVLVEPQYTHASPFDENGFAIVTLGGRASTGIIDRNGDYVLEPQWDLVYQNGENCYSVAKDMQWGHIDMKSNTLVEPRYHYQYEFTSDGYAIVTEDGIYRGIIDTKGNPIVDTVYDGIAAFSDGLSAVSLDRLWGCVNTKGEIVIPIKYERITTISDGMVVAYPYYRKYYEAARDAHDALLHGPDFIVYQYQILSYDNEELFSCAQKIYQAGLNFEQTAYPDLLRKPGYTPIIDLNNAPPSKISLSGYRAGYHLAPRLGSDDESSMRIYTPNGEELLGFFYLTEPASSEETAAVLPPIDYLPGPGY